jgi:flagellar hook-associated protein 1 FlgK
MGVQSLETAKTALIAFQAAIDVSSHNVANAQTEGYVRQTAELSSIPGNTLAGSEVGGIGGGVELTNVQRMTDNLLSVQINAQTANQSRDQVVSDALAQVEDIFNDTTDGGIAQTLSDMFSAWQKLGSQPTEAAIRDEVIQDSGNVADAIRQRASDVSALGDEMDREVVDEVRQVNDLAQQIADLNDKISTADNSAASADLLDLRDQAMTKLSGLCGATAIPEANNTIDVVIGGQRLVQDNHTTALTTVLDPDNPGKHLVSLGGNTTLPGLSGSIAGQLDVRDNYLPKYTAKLDTLAQTLADAMNKQHEAGFDLQNNAGQALFTYDPTSPAASIRFSAAIAADNGLLAAASATDQDGDGQNATAMQEVSSQKLLGDGLQTIQEYNADAIAQLGSDASSANNTADTRTQVLTDLTTRYQANAGVSLDEEAIDVVKYQKEYEAAARIVDVSLQMLDSVLAIWT